MTASTDRRIGLPPLKRNEAGRPLCRWCGTEVTPPRRTFCSEGCVHEYQIRSDPGYVRRKVYERDGGVCALCGLSTGLLARELSPFGDPDLWHTKRAKDPLSREEWYQLLLALGYPVRVYRPRSMSGHEYPPSYEMFRLTLWDADHIVPVIEGGGGCGLDNYRTLCVPCHKQVTADLRKRLAKPKPSKRQPAINRLFGALVALSVACGLLVGGGPVGATETHIERKARYAPIAYEAAAYYSINGHRLVAVIDCETGEKWDPYIVSPTNDHGLAQYHVHPDGSSLLDQTPWAGQDFYDPEVAIWSMAYIWAVPIARGAQEWSCYWRTW